MIQLYKKSIIIIIQSILLTGLFCSSGIAGDEIGWGRFLVKPQITIEEKYSDNAFLEPDDTKQDTATIISPGLSGYLAFTDYTRLGAYYNGAFSYYSTYDDLNSQDNKGAIDWSLEMPAGSTFMVGANILDSSIRPYNLDDREKPYLVKTAFAHANLKPGEFTEIGFRYDFTSREFDELSDTEEKETSDDYDHNLFTVDYVNRYFPRFPFLLEYRYTMKNRSDIAESATDSSSNAIYVGARWTPETRLSGNLRIGYQNTDYEGIRDVDTLVADTALTYRLTDMTTLQFIVNRSLIDSTATERDTGKNYTFTTWGGNINYWYSDPLNLYLQLRYQDKEYDETVPRQDDIYSARIGLNYSLNRWVEFLLSYQYAERNSDAEEYNYDYKENSGYLGIRTSLYIN